MKRTHCSKIRTLKFQERKMRQELNDTMKEISEDTKKREKEDACLIVGERQKLANRFLDMHSKLLRIKDKRRRQEIMKNEESSKQVRSKIESSYANAASRHNRLLWTTVELQRMKDDESAIRKIAKNNDKQLQNKEKSMKQNNFNKTEVVQNSRSTSAMTMSVSTNGKESNENTIQSILRKEESQFSREVKKLSPNRNMAEHRQVAFAPSSLPKSTMQYSTKEHDFVNLARNEHLERVQKSLSSMGLDDPRDQLHKADALKQKYDLTREMRNLAHGQMISRPNHNSYWKIVPPYRRPRKNFVHVRRPYVMKFYENKISMDKARDNKVKPFLLNDHRFKDKNEVQMYKLASGRIVSTKRIEEFLPCKMKLEIDDDKIIKNKH